MLTLRPADVNQVVDHSDHDTITCLQDAVEDDWFDFFTWMSDLPFMCDIFFYKNWMLLHECISSTGPSLNIKHALKSEVVAICVFLLFIKVPPPIKKASARVLASFSPAFHGTPDESNQEEVENLVLDLLGSGREGSIVEVQRQVCLSISFLASSVNDCSMELVFDPSFEDISYRSLELKFGPGINDRLLQLIRDPSCSSKLTYPLLSAIANIAPVSHDMTEKLFKTEVSECWLGNLMDKILGQSFLEAACLAIACIVSYACREVKGDDTELWNHFKSQFVPVIVDKCFRIENGPYLARLGALALLWITKFAASSPRRIDDLVNGGVLKTFFIMNDLLTHDDMLRVSVAGIKTILSVGDVGKRKRGQGPKYNKYADLIDDFECGWDFLLDPYKKCEDYSDSIAYEARIDLVLKYRPAIYYGDGPWWGGEDYDLGSSSSDDESDDEENEMLQDDEEAMIN